MSKILKDTEINLIKGKNIILVGGCFDILHKGHIEFLNKSKQLGKVLIVLLESDENVEKLKGKNRPINNQAVRANNLAEIESADYIILLTAPDSPDYYYNLVKSVKPDIIAITERDPLKKTKEDQAKLVGGKVVEAMKRNSQYSSTKIVQKIQKK